MAEPVSCRGAVSWGAKEPLKIENVTIAAPKAHEVRVKLVATGVCHTDWFTMSGSDPEGLFPCVFGHEGAGVVESVGADVTTVAVGDHVILLYTPECGECKFCRNPKTNLCQKIRSTQGKGVMPEGTSRISVGTTTVSHYMGCSTFAEYAVVADISVVKIRDDVPLDKVCLLACGITTGLGAVRYTCNVERGSTVAVWGLGCVGLSCIQGAKERGAVRIIGVDINPDKFEAAREFGATDCVNPADFDKPIQQVLVEMTEGGLDYTFECVGRVDTMRAALEACHKGWGESCIIGVAGSGQEISTRPFQLVTGRVWRGSAFGGVKSRSQLPGIIDEYMEGKVKVDEFVSATYKLEDINEAFEDMNSGKNIRGIIVYS